MTALLLRLDRLARNLTPVALSVLLVMVATLPLYLPFYGPIAPNIALMAGFYWPVYRPDLFPASAAFLVGLWQDILTGAPLGLCAVVMVLMHALLVPQRRFFQGKSFGVVWWAFMLVAAAAVAVMWLLFMALERAPVDPGPALFQLALTIALYPFVTWLFAWVHHSVLRQG